MNLKEEFISHEQRPAMFSLGRTLASSLTGFIAGLAVGLVFGLAIWYALSLR